MSSPFSTIEEFNGVLDGPTEGAIYTFAATPVINNIALLAAVGIFIWFIVKTYSTHAEPSRMDKSMNHLSSFIVIGLLSLVVANHRSPERRMPITIESNVQNMMQNSRGQGDATAKFSQANSRQLPLGFAGMLSGMVSLGLPNLRRSFKYLGNQRKARSRRRYRPRR
ncbi:MAG: hypothetical protein AAGC93_08500 [Cyanobacteria bacterium P01_F01_bin.53]